MRAGKGKGGAEVNEKYRMIERNLTTGAVVDHGVHDDPWLFMAVGFRMGMEARNRGERVRVSIQLIDDKASARPSPSVPSRGQLS